VTIIRPIIALLIVVLPVVKPVLCVIIWSVLGPIRTQLGIGFAVVVLRLGSLVLRFVALLATVFPRIVVLVFIFLLRIHALSFPLGFFIRTLLLFGVFVLLSLRSFFRFRFPFWLVDSQFCFVQPAISVRTFLFQRETYLHESWPSLRCTWPIQQIPARSSDNHSHIPFHSHRHLALTVLLVGESSWLMDSDFYTVRF